MCRRGARVIQKNVITKIGSDNLVTYVVWLPVLNFQKAPRLQRNAHRYEKLIPGGPRTLHYADLEGYSGNEYGKIVEIPYGAPAWDIYFAFGADEEWGETPPLPTYWEHQLGGLAPERQLNGPRFAEQVRKLLAETEE